jgi:hypothetical protein
VKKIIAILLACMYLLVSSGLLVEIHHCMGRIADTDITIFADDHNDKCGKCGMEKSALSKHCCKDEYKQVKISADQKISSLQYIIDIPVASYSSFRLPYLHELVEEKEIAGIHYPNGPPARLSASRQSLLCVFRI